MAWPILGAVFGRTLLGFATRVGIAEGASWFATGKGWISSGISKLLNTEAGQKVAKVFNDKLQDRKEDISDATKTVTKKVSKKVEDTVESSLGLDDETLKESQSWIKKLFGFTNFGTVVGGAVGTFFGGAKTKIGKFFRGLLGSVIGTIAVNLVKGIRNRYKKNDPVVQNDSSTPAPQRDFTQRAQASYSIPQRPEQSASATKLTETPSTVFNENGTKTNTPPGVQLTPAQQEKAKDRLQAVFNDGAGQEAAVLTMENRNKANGHFKDANTTGVQVDAELLKTIDETIAQQYGQEQTITQEPEMEPHLES